MTALDWIIVVFTVLMALWGYAQGLIVGALSLAGFAAGAFIGSRLGPLLLAEGSESPYAPLFALVGALMLGGILASGLEIIGFRLRHGLGDRFGIVDGIGGSALVACLGLGLVWIAGAVALQTPGAVDLRDSIQRSAILSYLNDHLPPSGPILRAFARFDPFPQISGPQADVAEPNSRIARDPQVRAAGRSVVRILGTASSARSLRESNQIAWASRCGPLPPTWTVVSSWPATTWALVTTTSSPATQPLP